MADKSPIEWTDATANAVNGCSPVSPGCKRCFAMRQAHRTDVRRGLTVHTDAGMVWTGEVRFHERALQQVLSWRRPRRIFWNAHGDLFHPAVPDAWIHRCIDAMRETPHHIHQVLTKRSERMLEFVRDYTRLPDDIAQYYDLPTNGSVQLFQPLRNVWFGVSVEDQARADERIPNLLATPAAVRFLSCEPLLGPIDLTRIMEANRDECFHNRDNVPFMFKDRVWTETRGSLNALTGHYWGEDLVDGQWEGWCDEHKQPSPGFGEPGYHEPLGWVIVGGESGPGARPMHPDWARSLRDQCAAAGVPFFFKQNGEYASVSEVEGPGEHHRFPDGATVRKLGKKAAGRLLDGVEHNGVPA